MNLSDLIVEFETDISNIKLSNLATIGVHHLDISQYIIKNFNITNVIDQFDPERDIFTSQQDLVSDSKMDTLIQFIYSQKVKIYPPILELAGNQLIIRDGKHRIGLCWHLNYEEIPFLIRKSNSSILHRIL